MRVDSAGGYWCRYYDGARTGGGAPPKRQKNGVQILKMLGGVLKKISFSF